jgi:hypothetical protein
MPIFLKNNRQKTIIRCTDAARKELQAHYDTGRMRAKYHVHPLTRSLRYSRGAGPLENSSADTRFLTTSSAQSSLSL